jgi:16S rRNA (guanine1207-N2)-methyltransferase
MTRRDDRILIAWQSGELPLPDSGPIAVLRAEDSGLYESVGRERFLCQQGDRSRHDALALRGLAVSPDPPAAAAAAIVLATRQRADTLGAVATALQILPPDAPIALAGARSEGIDSLLKTVGRAFAIEGRMAKAHGRVFRFRRPESLPEAVAGWAADYALAPNDEGFVTGPGMFSPDHVDPGSRRLAERLKGQLSGRVADLGAGWGWLSATALSANPGIEAIDLYEAEARALEAARLNVRDQRATFHWTDVRGLAGGQYDWVITNPPFHQSRAAEPVLGAAFIAAAARMLRPHGRLALVANRSLPYEAPLAAAFGRVETVSEDSAYKVIEASRPKKRR